MDPTARKGFLLGKTGLSAPVCQKPLGAKKVITDLTADHVLGIDKAFAVPVEMHMEAKNTRRNLVQGGGNHVSGGASGYPPNRFSPNQSTNVSVALAEMYHHCA